MSINSSKSWFALDRGCKFVFLTDYIYVKKGQSVVFSIFYSKRYVDMRVQVTLISSAKWKESFTVNSLVLKGFKVGTKNFTSF